MGSLFKVRPLYLTIVLFLLIIAQPLYSFKEGAVFVTILFSLIPVVGVYAVAYSKKNTIIAICFAVPIVCLSWFIHLSGMTELSSLNLLLGAIFYLYIIVVVIGHIIKENEVTIETISSAISAYLTVGVFFSLLYMLIEKIYPGSFLGGSSGNELFYFSYVTLTTLGFGDIVPVHAFARSLSVIEASFGTLYLTVIIAFLIGKYKH